MASFQEREALEAERKKAHYLKLHAEGKTDEAKADMERLAAVRKRREEAAKRKKEEEEQAAQGNSRGGGGDSGSQADASGPVSGRQSIIDVLDRCGPTIASYLLWLSLSAGETEPTRSEEDESCKAERIAQRA